MTYRRSSDCSDSIIKSQPSRALSFIRFKNVTQRTVDVIWINYEGVRVKYKTLQPEEFFDVNTYVAHPWMFLDALSHERLNANSRHLYEPGPWYEPFIPDIQSGKILPQDIQPRRVIVNITSPLYSLKLCAMNVICKQLRDSSKVWLLEIPKQLQQDLGMLMKFC